jgi:uncharacterized protein YgbK (DUF1537 family)
MPQTKIIVLDDDPTGSQTVHGCLLLTRWDTDTLRTALSDASPLFFVLTNTRGMGAIQAAEITRTVSRHLNQALDDLARAGRVIHPILVSRSDSTLRGHYPVETDVIAEELGPFDAHFLIPAFFEGGRITRDSVHYLMVDGKAVPVHETEFARDSVFGYRHSYLPDYIEEKTRGAIQATAVRRFLLPEVRTDCLDSLLSLHGNTCCVVDAETQSDLDNFCRQLRAAAAQGKRFLFRSAASLLTSLARLGPQPVAATDMHQYVRAGRPGAIIVGSHVKKTTLQLQQLLQQPGTLAMEVDVDRIDAEGPTLLAALLATAAQAHTAGLTPVIYTSRTEKTFADQKTRLDFGARVSSFLMQVVRGLPPTLGFLISKGGITSNDVLSAGLALTRARVLGQILAGCSVVRCPQDHPRYPAMPVVIFPGNVGDENGLATVYRRLSNP